MKIFSKKIDKNVWLPSKTEKNGRYYIDTFKDEFSKERVVFSKLDKGVAYSKIKTNCITHYFVIDGDFKINDSIYENGTYIMIDGSEIFTPSTENGCKVLCIYTKGYKRIE